MHTMILGKGYGCQQMIWCNESCLIRFSQNRVRGLVVMIVACQVMDPGSIPGERISFFPGGTTREVPANALFFFPGGPPGKVGGA
jgi:hypothetical protein